MLILDLDGQTFIETCPSITLPPISHSMSVIPKFPIVCSSLILSDLVTRKPQAIFGCVFVVPQTLFLICCLQLTAFPQAIVVV